MDKTKIVEYLNDHYSINGSFYWRITTDGGSIKMIPSPQKHTRHLRAFGMGCFGKTESGYYFYFFSYDLLHAYGFDLSSAGKIDRYESIKGETIDEVMQQVSAFIIVNGMCDLRHKDLVKTLRLSL